MLKRISYLLLSPQAFRNSALQRPRLSCIFILSMPLLILVSAVVAFARPAPPWSGIIYVLIIILIGILLGLYTTVQRKDVVHAWAYMRGKDGAEFWKRQ